MTAFTPGNIVIYRVGSGSGDLLGTGNPVFVDEYTPAGVLVQSVALPTSDAGSQQSLIASGTATSEGLLTLSANGQYLLLTGYDATPPATGLSGTTGTAVNRIIGRIDASANVDTTMALTDFASGNNPRSVASTNGADIWVTGGAGGIRYASFGAADPGTSTQLSTTVTNLRQVAIFDGQIYVSTSSGSAVRIGTVGTGTPTTAGQTITNLPGFPTGGSPYGFFLADLTSAVAGVDTLYVADDGTAALTKYSLVSGSWVTNGTIGIDADDYRGLTGLVLSGTDDVTLYATRKGGSGATGGGELVAITDTSGYNGAFAGTPALLATAAANTAFRGVAFAPGSPDVTAPALAATDPLDNATSVAASANIVLTFSEAVRAGSGIITISNGTDTRNISVSDAQVTLSGNTVTINPSTDLVAGTSYDVTMGSGVITDAAGNPFSGIAPDALDFTIVAAPPLPPTTLLINEVDADQTGTDAGEFVELYGTPNASLAGYTIVFYNGSNNQAYAAFDLDGQTLDANGYFVLGNSGVPGVDLIFTNNILQNGADAVALYLGDASSFDTTGSDATLVTAANLVDAVVYENNNPDDRELIDTLTPGQSQVNETERGTTAGATQSLQRVTGGAGGALDTTAFTQAPPTPGAANAVPATPAANGGAVTRIHDVQGPGATSPLNGTTVTVEGIVVGDFQAGDSDVGHSLNGFYLQEENADWDANALTSEGIFIFSGSAGFLDVNEGDVVRVTGTVSEFNGMTEVTVSGMTVVSTGNPLPAATVIDLPTAGLGVAQATATDPADYEPDLEAYEGMLVSFPETLTIVEQFNLDRFNEIRLSANGRIENFTNEHAPGTAEYEAFLQEVGKRTIYYDDGQNTQNEAINYLGGFDPDDDSARPSTVLPGEPGYDTASAYRMGDTVTGLTGVLDYQQAGDPSSAATWRLRAINDAANTFVHANVRPEDPPEVGGPLKVASFNVLNYFITTSGNIANGLAVRGANNADELARQTEKLVNFIQKLGADVIGLTELQNDFLDSNPGNNTLADVNSYEGVAIAYLVDQLNAAAGSVQYAWINPVGQLDGFGGFGGDAISVGFIYKPSKVTVAVGTTIQKLDDSDAEAAALTAQSSINAIFNGVNTSRAALAVTFEETASGEDFTAVIDHFKSKSGNGAAGSSDEDKLDGQGAWQNQRELAARALVDWIKGSGGVRPTGSTDLDILLLGDFNAYTMEQALGFITGAGYHAVGPEHISDPYSFVFDAQNGALDHGFASASLNAQITNAAEWHINADEADALDYNTDFGKDALYFDPDSPARESDHDPLVIGLKLASTAQVSGITVYDAAPSLNGKVGAAPVATNALQLVRLGNFATTNDAGTMAAPNAEVVAYDKTTAKFYIQNTSEGHIEIVSLSASGALTKTGDINLTALPSYGGVNSVAVHNGIVAVAYANSAGDQPGRVVLFDANGTQIKSITVGIGPDMVTFSADGSLLLVANEAEMAGNAANPIQTAGGISIIDMSGGAASAAIRNTISFDDLNGSEGLLRTHGVAISPGNSAENDIEPEYITIAGTKAYVTLQEVNAVAVIDLANASADKPLAVLPLGAVNHSLAGNEFDGSDRDGPGNTPLINIKTTPLETPIFGLLQPDAIASFTVSGATYLITANEGDQRVIGGLDDANDVARLSAVPNSLLTPELQALKSDADYARLNVLLHYGDTDNDGVIDQLHALGGRGVSIFRQETDGSFTKVRETGGEFEKILASIAAPRFNNDQVVADTPDDRSDNKGPEPEGITVGEIGGHTYAFIGLERQSGVLVYDVTDPANASFVSYVPPLSGSAADLGPEVLKFLAAADNPTGTPLVATANEVANGGMTLYAALTAGYTQQVQIASGSLNVSHPEGNSGTTDFVFTVERTGGTLGAVDFTLQLASSSATPSDFDGVASAPTTINGTIAAGAASAAVTVKVNGDTTVEPNETFTLTLLSATSSQAGITTAVNAGQNTATGTIQSEEALPVAFTLQLLHLSDGEAGLLASQTAPNLAAMVDKFEDAFVNHTLILSGGDNFIPGPFLNGGTDLSIKPVLNAVSGSTISADPAVNIPIAAVDIAILNAIGVEASTLGNHDFDLGSRVLSDAITPGAGWVGAAFPYLSANLDFSGDNNADFRLGQRFTNTVGNGAGTPTNLANTLAGRVAPAAVVVKDGEKIGLIGATTQLLESISSPTGTEVKGFPFGPGPNGEDDNMTLLAQQLQPIIDEMIAEGINKIIIQSHLQLLGNEEALAQKLHGVDIILAAGSHTRTGDGTPPPAAFPGHDATFAREYPVQTTGSDGKPILIVATDNEYTYLGRLVVDFDANGELVTGSVSANSGINGTYASTAANVAAAWGVTEAQLATTAFADGTKGDKVRDLTAAVQGVINVKDGSILGFTDVYLEGDRAFIRNQETNLGDLASDANAFVARNALPNGGFVVALQNGGGIRAQIGAISDPDPVTGVIDKLPPSANPSANKPEGAVSQLDLENALRFNNRMMVFDTTPAGLLNILNWGAGVPANAGGFPQIGGVRYSYDPDLPGNVGNDANSPGSVIGQRILDVALIDQNGFVIAKIANDGVVLPGAPAHITVVVPNFTANNGDGYPIKANGENFRFLLDNGQLSGPISESLNFTATNVVPANALGQQDAFKQYIGAFHGTAATAYDLIDTPQTLDTRIQNLNVRPDTVLGADTSHWKASVDTGPHPAGWLPSGIGDFNADGTGDLAWFNPTTRSIDIWKLTNGQWAGTAGAGPHPAGYLPVSFSDFNHDGTSDVLWFNATTRDVDLWKISNGQWAGSVDIGPHPAGWTPVLYGDFSGDGWTDIAWHNPTTNALDIWKIKNDQWAGSVAVGPHPGDYKPVLTGDFNGDGTDDIVWYNAATNDVDIWKMSNGQWAGSSGVGPHPAGWQPIGAGDFNLDGTSDIVWYNPTTNGIDIWKIVDGHWAGSIGVGAHPPGAVPVGVGDFDHDGVSDISWHVPTTDHIDNWLLAYS